VKTPVYFISGLGIDERAFIKIKMPEPYEMHFMRWIEPLPDESIGSYAKRLFAGVDASKPIIVAGLSFGGMVAVELSKFFPVKKLILISSIPERSELPRLYRFFAFIRLYNYVPVFILKRTNFFTHWLFGTKTKEEKSILQAVMRDMSDTFLHWALDKAANWKNTVCPPDMSRIHGRQDRVLYCPAAEISCAVPDAGHFMVYTHAEEVNRALREILGKEQTTDD
jgi:pimeloyl-ACP methyl ester carboxylesterase